MSQKSKRRMLSRKEALQVYCEACDSDPGEMCISWTLHSTTRRDEAKVRKSFHMERRFPLKEVA